MLITMLKTKKKENVEADPIKNIESFGRKKSTLNKKHPTNKKL